jgi:hypothetical protein
MHLKDALWEPLSPIKFIAQLSIKPEKILLIEERALTTSTLDT